MRTTFAILTALVGICLTPLATHAQLAIKAARVVTGTGEVFAPGVVLTREGRVESVGSDLAIPVEYKVIDAGECWVLPGFVDVHQPGPMSQPNERNPNVPYLSVVDSVNPQADYFQEALRNGITTVAVSPANSTMFGGQVAVLKTSGLYVNDMLVERDIALKISMRPPAGSRMSHLATMRREFNKAKKLKEGDKDAAAEKPSGQGETAQTDNREESGGEGSDNAEGGAAGGPPAASAAQTQQGLETLAKAIGGGMLSMIYCENAMDVGQAVRLIDEFQLRPLLILGNDCDKAADLIRKRNLPVVLDSNLVFWRNIPRTRSEEKVNLLQAFNGTSAMFQADTNANRSTIGSNYLWYQAATAVKHGWSHENALAALTTVPAKAIGLDSMVGSIAAGHDADLVIWSGDPLATQSWVETVVIRGEVVYEKAKDARLRRLLEATVEGQ